MTAIEMAIFCDGFPLYKRKFMNIRAIDDDDLVASSLYAAFYRIQKSLVQSDDGNAFLKLDMGNHHMHALKKLLIFPGMIKTREMYIYLIEDRNIQKKISSRYLNRIINAFLESYRSRIEEMLKKVAFLSEFDHVVDKILGRLLKKSKS